MLHRFQFAILLFILCASHAFSQHTFIRNTGLPLSLYKAVQSTPTEDGGMMTVSSNNDSIFNFSRSIVVIRFNASGEILWTRQYDTPTEIEATSIARNGNVYAIAGVYNAYDKSISTIRKQFIFSIDGKGSLLWWKNYTKKNSSVAWVYTINTTPSGKWILNSIFQEQDKNGDAYLGLTCIDKSGNILWAKKYQECYTYGYSIVTSADEVLVKHGNDVFLANSQGNTKWSVNLPQSYHAPAPVEVDDYRFVFARNLPNGKFRLFCISGANGNVEWETAEYQGFTWKLMQTSDDHILAFGTVGSSFGLFQFDFLGNMWQAVQFKSSPGMNAYSLSAVELCDRSILVAGSSGGAVNELSIQKISPELRSYCTDSIFNDQEFVTPIQASPVSVGATDLEIVTESIGIPSRFIDINPIAICENNAFSLNLGPDTILCQGTAYTLKIPDLHPCLEQKINWSTGDTGNTVTIHENGTYWAISVYGTLSDTDTVTVLFEQDHIPLDPFYAICEDNNEGILLDAGPFKSFRWEPAGDTSRFFLVQKPGTYTASAKTFGSCILYHSFTVGDACEPLLYVPNAFSPNDDGLNDEFRPVFRHEVSEYRLQLFNRWGEKIFESHNISQGWRGEQDFSYSPPGSYIWHITYRGSELSNTGNQSRTGIVTLIR